jgi:hypothetical protein
MASKIKGGCLCGAVRYECGAEPRGVSVCHCTHCQKTSGGAFSVNVVVPADSLSLPRDKIATYTVTADSGRPLVRSFCPVCGSSIGSESQNFPGMFILKAGTLDDTSWVQPMVHIWTGSRQPWVAIPATIKTFEKGRT